jgi:hypothetical protein
LWHAAGRSNAFATLAGQAIEMCVARRDVAEQVGDADHGPCEIVVVKADGTKHGSVRRSTDAASGEKTMAIGLH